MVSRKLLFHETVVILFLTFMTCTNAVSNWGKAEVVHEWLAVEFDWNSDAMRSQYEADERYIRDHNLISGIKIYRDQIYVTVPRIKYTLGVPSTLNKVIKKGNQTVLSPYPDWNSQKLGDCKALQCAMSMEVDPITGYMYVIDPGRSGLLGKGVNQSEPIICPPKLVVYDLNNGRLVRSHDFPPNVVSNETNFLNDIVLDRGDPTASTARWVYITDAADSKLIVFDLQTNESRAIQHPSMDAESGIGSNITVNGKVYRLQVPIDGLAISANFQYVYYCPLGSNNLYQVSSRVLRDKNENFNASVRLVGAKVSQTGGMTYATDNLYYGALTKNAVYRWEVAADVKSQGVTAAKVIIKTETEIVADNDRLQWPDSFTVDENGYLWFTACRAQLFLLGGIDFTGAQGPNYRIWRVNISEKSYLAPPSSSRFPSSCPQVEKSIILSFVVVLLLIWS